MKKTAGSKFLDVLGIFAAIILSIVFIAMAFALPIYHSVVGLIQPKAITTMIQHVDYVEILRESEEVSKAMKELGIPAENVNELIRSNAATGVLEDCAEKLTEIFSRADVDLSEFNVTYLKELADTHLEEILRAVEDVTGETIDASEARRVFHEALEENASVIDEVVAELAPIKKTLVKYSAFTTLVQNSVQMQGVLTMVMLEVLLLALIYVVRLRNYSGFIWIAVDTGVVGLLLVLPALVVGSNLATMIVAAAPNYMQDMLFTAIGGIQTTLVTAVAACFGVMVLSIVACVALRANKRRRMAAITPITPTENM